MDRVRKSSWTPAEDSVIRDLHNELGSRWTTIAKYLPGRSEQAIENRWQSTLKYRSETATSFTRTRRCLSGDGGTSPETSFLMYSTLKDNTFKAECLTTDSMSTADSDLMLPGKLISSVEAINECSESGFVDLSSINMASLCTTSDAAVSVPLHEFIAAKGGDNLFAPTDLTSIDASSLFDYTIPDVEVTNQSTLLMKNQSKMSVGNQSRVSAAKQPSFVSKRKLAATPRILRSRQRKKSMPAGKWKAENQHAGDFTALLRRDDSNSRDGSRLSSAGTARKSSANQRTPVGRGFRVTEPSPIHDLPFSPSQFLNSPVVTGLSCCDALTSTPLGKRTALHSSPVNIQHHHSASVDYSNGSWHTPGGLCLTPSGICQTPSFKGFVVPLTPTPIKNALLEFEGKRNTEHHRSYRVDLSGRLVEDVDELIRQDLGLSFIRSPVQHQLPVARRRRKLNVKIKRNCPVTTPVAMTTRTRLSPARNPRGRPPKEHYKARMQISFDDADVKPYGGNFQGMEGGETSKTDVMCGRTRDQRDMTQLARHWLRRRTATQLLFDQ